MRVLVVGGAGYIGSHFVRQLGLAGHIPVVLDSLIRGHRQAVPDTVSFYEGDMADVDLVRVIIQNEKIEVVAHFAAFAYIGESFKESLNYYDNNVAKTVTLLKVMGELHVSKFIFSSTCATYGIADSLPIVEGANQLPINPYGRSKLIIEELLRSLAASGKMASAVFRYFNAAGASEDGSIGEDHDPEPHLIPLAIKAAVGVGQRLKVFGTDYATSDGTCLRDYVHVDDISRAHVTVLQRLEGSVFLDYNLGTGSPTSVMEILDTVHAVVGKPVPYDVVARREGDPPALYADFYKAEAELNWKPKYSSIKEIVTSAWKWHSKHPNGYNEG